MKNVSLSHGFTLVETMIAVMLLSMISLIGYQGVIFTIKQWNKGESILELSLYTYQSKSAIRQILAGIERTSYQRNGDYIYTFSGKHSTVKFITKFENTRQGGLYVCEFYANKAKSALVMSYGLFHPENGGFEKPYRMQYTVVLNDIEKIRFWYFGSQHGEAARWYRQWDAETRLPRLIKYELVMDNGVKEYSVAYIETSDV